ncbi:methyl-accepting chemotaxis protein [Treponema pectinovorum]|uniref:methyl-accepting chemotaxis protein n=1 Tax=Treponema pectinovorum TaxID=164 RepID=UPI0011C779AE|nr:methyl-accepting chemotaxis protein [Treponema pectinovorum]
MNKKIITFLTRSLIDATGRNMWKGIVSECKKDQVPLITFRGPVLNKGPGSIIYELINDDTFAGIISWASSDVDQSTYDYYKRFSKTPLVCMTFKIEGKPLIVTDCKTGIIELIDHLVEFHGYKKIAFIRGPENHVYARERYEGYLEGLKKHNLDVRKDLISECGYWSLKDGANGIETFLKRGLKPGSDFEAVIGVGDNVAIGAQEELQRRGYDIPSDVAVCGFNGTEDAAWSNPSITSVEMPFYGQGVQAYKTLKAIFNNQPYEMEFKYKTKLVPGESCGCTSLSVKNAYFENIKNANDSSAKSKGLFKAKNIEGAQVDESQIIKKLQTSTWQNQLKEKIIKLSQEDRFSNQNSLEFFKDFAGSYISSLIGECLNENSKSAFIKTISKGLNKFSKVSKEFSVWQNMISTTRISLLQELTSLNSFYAKAENLFQQARILIDEIDSRIQKQANLLETRKEAVLRQISTDILSCSDIPKLLELIEKSILKLGMTGCYVALYNDCKYTEQNKQIPQTSRLVLAVKKGEHIALPEGGLNFNTSEIIPDSINNSGDFAIYEVESLHYQNRYLGYIVFESLDDNGIAYSTLRDQISCSLNSALLLEQRIKSRAVLEDTMHAMTEKADVVSTHSERIFENINSISKSMDSTTSNIKNISDNINTVASTVDVANKMITEASSSITTLVQSTDEITKAIHMINDIAEKTNVLALNAAIEAAHAGDAGRGFSVVAKEVKSLAAQTVSSTSAIQDLVEKNTENTKQVEEVILSTNKAIKTISSLSENIKASITDQVSAASTISSQLQDTTAGTQQISSAIVEIAKVGENLKL